MVFHPVSEQIQVSPAHPAHECPSSHSLLPVKNKYLGRIGLLFF
jgi:hypothetical protein